MTLMDLLRKAKSQETCVHPEEDKTDEHVSSDETTDNDSEDGDSEEDEVSSSDEEEEVPLRVVVAIPKKSSRPPLPTMSDDTESDEDSVYEDEEDEGLPIKRPRCSIEDFRSQLSPTKSSSINGTRINMSHPPERSPEGRVIAETLRIESIANLLHLIGQRPKAWRCRTSVSKVRMSRSCHKDNNPDNIVSVLNVDLEVARAFVEQTIVKKAYAGSHHTHETAVSFEEDIIRVLFEPLDREKYLCYRDIIMVTHSVDVAEVRSVTGDRVDGGGYYTIRFGIFGSSEDIDTIRLEDNSNLPRTTTLLDSISEYLKFTSLVLQTEMIPALLCADTKERDAISSRYYIPFTL